MHIFLILSFLAQQNLVYNNNDPIDITDQCLFLSHHLLTPWCCGAALDQDDLIIKEESEFLKFKNEICSCSYVPNPELDFDNYILLVKWSEGTFCESDFRRTIIKDGANKRIIYSIPERSNGDCTSTTNSWHGNFVLIPKIFQDYTFEFELNSETVIPDFESPELDSLRLQSLRIEEELSQITNKLTNELSEIKTRIEYIESLMIQPFSTKLIKEYERDLELNGILCYTFSNSTNLFNDREEKNDPIIIIPPHSAVRVYKRYGKYLKVKYRTYDGWVEDDFINYHRGSRRGIDILVDERPVIPETRRKRMKLEPADNNR